MNKNVEMAEREVAKKLVSVILKDRGLTPMQIAKIADKIHESVEWYELGERICEEWEDVK